MHCRWACKLFQREVAMSSAVLVRSMKLRSCILSPQFFLLQELSTDQQNMSIWSQKHNVLVQNIAHYEIIRQKRWHCIVRDYCAKLILTDRFLLLFQWRRPSKWIQFRPMLSFIFTTQCTIEQSAVLQLHVRPSVRLSVMLVDCDHIGLGWKSWKSIARTINQTPSLLVAQRPPTLRRTWVKFGRHWRWGGEKVARWSTKAAISLKSVKLEESYYGGPIGTH